MFFVHLKETCLFFGHFVRRIPIRVGMKYIKTKPLVAGLY